MRWSRKAIAAPRACAARATWPRSIASREIFGTGLPASRGSTTGMALLPCYPPFGGPHLFADVTEIEKQHEENGMNGGADAVHRGRHLKMRAEHRNRRAGQIEIEQHARADEEGAREEFADLFPVDGHTNRPCAARGFLLPLKPGRACRRTPPCARTCRQTASGPANGRRDAPSRHSVARCRRRPF